MSNRRKKNKAEKRNYMVWTIRGLLILSLLINLAFIIFQLFSDHTVTKEEVAEALNKRVELLFWALVTFTLTFLPDYFEKYQKIHIPHILETAIVAFIYAGIFLSARFELYYQVFWWDDALHGLSGVIIGFIGFIAIYKINGKYSMNISPLLVAVFAFSFAITIGVIWEIFEFGMDILLGTTLQSWDLPDTEILMGKPFQGSGLRDTMSDLIVNSFGALFTSIICYFLYKNEKKKSLDMMREIFPH
jgi:hypothetical protein